jgi:hypothetical protein
VSLGVAAAMAWVVGCTPAPTSSAPAARPDATEVEPVADAGPVSLDAPAEPDAARVVEGATDMGRSEGGASPPARAGKRAGARCGRRAECAAGLNCCDTSFVGHCGGANTPDTPQDPCVLVRTCTASPCAPLSFPP